MATLNNSECWDTSLLRTGSLPVASIQVPYLSSGDIPNLVSVSAFMMDFQERSASYTVFPGKDKEKSSGHNLSVSSGN